MMQVLRPGSDNEKLGRRFKVGKFKNQEIWQLSLEEKGESCPTYCEQWHNCYGNGMPFAARHRVNPTILVAINQDLHTLDGRRRPYVVRLHVLGDFGSIMYVDYWQSMVNIHPLLYIWGYTHSRPDDPIGMAISRLVLNNPGRVSILRSDGVAGDVLPRAIVVRDWKEVPKGFVKCPEQLGVLDSCASCGICCNGKSEVAFKIHGRSV